MRSKFLAIIFLLLLVVSALVFYFNNALLITTTKQSMPMDKCEEKHKLNSKEYWDCRFKTLDWQKNQGDEQTIHFYTLLVNCMPEYIQNEINSNQYSVVDFGCAQGEGTEFFANSFPKAYVTGVDISNEAIEIAKNKNKKAKFLDTDLTKSQDAWDVLISSNTFEHFYEPWNILGQLTNKISRYLIVLVPFEQPGIPSHEHFYSFNRQNIPQILNEFKLIYTKIAYPDPKFWGEKQILLIYKHT